MRREWSILDQPKRAPCPLSWRPVLLSGRLHHTNEETMNPAQEIFENAVYAEAARLAREDDKAPFSALPQSDRDLYLARARRELHEFLATQGVV